MRRWLVIFIFIFTAGCSHYEYQERNVVNGINQTYSYRLICIDGVEYVQVAYGLSAHYKLDGTLYPCKVN